MLLLEELAKGYGLFCQADLLMLCKTVLLKPGHDEKDFEQLFHQYLRQMQQLPKDNQKQTSSSPTQTKPEPDRANTENSEEVKTEAEKETTQKSADPLDPSTPDELIQAKEMISIYFEDAPKSGGGFRMDSSQRDISKMIFQKAFILQGDDYLLPTRVLQQAWRSMRSLQEVGTKERLDLEETIRQVAQTGFLGAPALKAAYQNTAELTLLIDASPSMVAFTGLARKITQTAAQGSHFKRLRIGYFNNIPEDYLFGSPGFQDPIDIAEFLWAPSRSVLVFSDAGAARGYLNWERVSETLAFLEVLNTPNFVWVNPVPRERWEHSTAEVLALKIETMFSSHPMEFRNAIKQLRGKLKT